MRFLKVVADFTDNSKHKEENKLWETAISKLGNQLDASW